jgi:hypothetical protein
MGTFLWPSVSYNSPIGRLLRFVLVCSLGVVQGLNWTTTVLSIDKLGHPDTKSVVALNGDLYGSWKTHKAQPIEFGAFSTAADEENTGSNDTDTSFVVFASMNDEYEVDIFTHYIKYYDFAVDANSGDIHVVTTDIYSERLDYGHYNRQSKKWDLTNENVETFEFGMWAHGLIQVDGTANAPHIVFKYLYDNSFIQNGQVYEGEAYHSLRYATRTENENTGNYGWNVTEIQRGGRERTPDLKRFILDVSNTPHLLYIIASTQLFYATETTSNGWAFHEMFGIKNNHENVTSAARRGVSDTDFQIVDADMDVSQSDGSIHISYVIGRKADNYHSVRYLQVELSNGGASGNFTNTKHVVIEDYSTAPKFSGDCAIAVGASGVVVIYEQFKTLWSATLAYSFGADNDAACWSAPERVLENYSDYLSASMNQKEGSVWLIFQEVYDGVGSAMADVINVHVDGNTATTCSFEPSDDVSLPAPLAAGAFEIDPTLGGPPEDEPSSGQSLMRVYARRVGRKVMFVMCASSFAILLPL